MIQAEEAEVTNIAGKCRYDISRCRGASARIGVLRDRALDCGSFEVLAEPHGSTSLHQVEYTVTAMTWRALSRY